MTRFEGIVLYAPLFFKIFTPNSVQGITLYPFILLRHKEYLQHQRLLNHEKIHIRQQQELFILPFYVIYLVHYSVNLLKYKTKHLAYLNICFEREAYKYDNDLTYLNWRPENHWIKFLLK